MDARCGCMFDILKQAVVDHIRSLYDVDSATQCTVVIRKCKSNDSDIYVTLGRRPPDTDVTVGTQQHPVTTVIFLYKICFMFTCLLVVRDVISSCYF